VDDAAARILIVGGGVVGLSASLFLARQGVRTCLVEKHPTTTIHPRSRGVNGRTMELMRELGLDEQVRSAGAQLAPAVGIHTGTSVREILAARGEGGWLFRKMRARGMNGRESKRSPTSACRCTQEDLEPILLAAAREREVDARFGTELVELEQDEHGVTSTLLDRPTGKRHTLRTAYVVAADGARSPTRERLGIARSGRDLGGHQLNIYFRADLSSLVKGREFSMCLIENPDVRGLFVSINNTDLWVFHVSYHPEKGEGPADFPPERCADLLRKAAGLPDLAVELKGVSPWQSAVRIADRYRDGRVFLAGDAAHAMPPWGGFGANTGIQDAHNLAWKLGAVLAGRAGEALLDTYASERVPVARAVADISGSLSDERGLIRVTPGLRMMWNMRKIFPYLTMGYGYASSAIALDDGPPPGPGTTELRGRPGTRAPHVWIESDGKRMSTLDLFGPGFTLFAGKDGDAWYAAARDAAERLGIRMNRYRIGIDLLDPEGAFSAAYRLKPTGAALVRPDGIVAWRARGRETAPGETLEGTLARILAR